MAPTGRSLSRTKVPTQHHMRDDCCTNILFIYVGACAFS